MEKTDTSTVRPHIPQTVAAGFTGEPIGASYASECEMRNLIPDAPDYDFTISVKGDSMEPEMRDGDLLACKWLDEPVYKPTRYYVVDTTEVLSLTPVNVANVASSSSIETPRVDALAETRGRASANCSRDVTPFLAVNCILS